MEVAADPLFFPPPVAPDGERKTTARSFDVCAQKITLRASIIRWTL